MTQGMTAAEISVLGSIFLNNKALPACEGMNLEPSDFSTVQGQTIYTAMRELVADDMAIDLTTIRRALIPDGLLDAAGGIEEISQIIDGVPAACNVRHYARLVIEESNKHKIDVLGQRLSHAAKEGTPSPQLLVEASTAIEDIRGKANLAETSLIGDIMRSPVRAAKHLPIGLRAVDAYTGGPALGELWMIGAWSGHGKSALQGHIALAAAVSDNPVSVLIFSAEMPKAALMNRLLANIAGVSVGRIIRGKLDDNDSERIAMRGQKLINAPIYIHDGPISDDGILSISRQMIDRKHVKMVLVDYVQLVSASGKDRRLQVEQVAMKLLSLAVEQGVSVIAASQLRKRADANASSEPTMHDLRESAALFETPHVVALIHRPDIGQYDMDNHITLDTTAVINIDKNRNGRTGRAKVAWDGPCLRFFNLEMEDSR